MNQPKNISKVEDIKHLNLQLRIYINDYKQALVVLFVNGYPNVIQDITTKDQLNDAWESVTLMGREYDINIFPGEDGYSARLYGLQVDQPGEQPSVNINDHLKIEASIYDGEKPATTNKKKEAK